MPATIGAPSQEERVHDNPKPTERENEEAPERVPEAEAMSGHGQEEPEREADPQDESEVTDS
jgi:hypothetical protein